MKPSWQVTKLMLANGLPGRRAVQVAAAGQTVAQVGELAGVATPEAAYRVAVLAVPFRPADREVAHLVAARAEIPGLGDQLHLRQDRVLRDQVEERAQPLDLVQLARERGRQVEAESVHVHLERPVAQAVHDQLDRARMDHVEAVAAAREVDVAPAIGRVGAVVRCVVDAA